MKKTIAEPAPTSKQTAVSAPAPPAKEMSMDKAKRLIQKTIVEHDEVFRRLAK